ncbi:CUB domain-containing protein [Pontibacter sp. G13]|uniref:CUB domain-containing protein n=1 Tax=Pontibacter sp. G13 TaxID=3074898 RepID=UPI00288B8BB6|nr:CUB domain-containing protein [Pontibacter sp. G13]WNJ21473.1 CUB domain-containing protein [Pontibacter sp. G13]
MSRKRRSFPQLVKITYLMVGLMGMGMWNLHAQNPYAAYFEEAYRANPSIPRGMLEAVAYTQTRMNHLEPEASCQGLPTYVGVMGLVEDGKGYFENTLNKVAYLSGYTIQEIKEDPRINILAYAKAYSQVLANKRLASRSVEAQQPVVLELSEIPQDDGSLVNQFAQDQQYYAILKEMESGHGTANHRRRSINYEQAFGKENLRVLSAPTVTVTDTSATAPSGERYAASRSSTCSASKKRADYMGAFWKSAHSNNFGSRNGEEIKYITIHTIQGSYASALAWFRNRRAGVSAHYVIRASDGQVTQMVCENDKAYHVKADNPYSIGIEHEGFIHDGASWYTQEMYESSAALVRDIISRHDLDGSKAYGGPPTDGINHLSNSCYHIKGHQHFNGNNHIDPGPYWDWDKYYRLINGTPKPEKFTAKRGEIFDNGGRNGNYTDQIRKTYLIQPEGATQAMISFRKFELEGDANRAYDYLDVYDGTNASGKLLGRFTGKNVPRNLIAKSGAFFLEFRSDCQVNKAGFHITYTSKQSSSSCANPTALTTTSVSPIGATLEWSYPAVPDKFVVKVIRNLENKPYTYTTHFPKITLSGLSANADYVWQVQAVCGNDSSAVIGGSFSTPNIPRNTDPEVYTFRTSQGRFYDTGGSFAGYTNNEHYVYRIIPEDGGRVELKFQRFDTEEEHDLMIIHDGVNTNSPILDTLQGTLTEFPTYSSSGNGLSIRFISDNRTQRPGWTSSWRSIGGTPPEIPEPDDQGGTGVDPVFGDIDPTEQTKFDPELNFNPRAPRTIADLSSSYSKSFTVEFDDQDKSGRGLANRFFCIAQMGPSGLKSNPDKGYFNDDFQYGLGDEWKTYAGTWRVSKGVLYQTDVNSGNTGLHTKLKQRASQVYVYNWQAMMKGTKNNHRHGLHFFASDPSQSNRGNSYFVWIRESNGKDYVEIYKTWQNKFDRKIRKEVELDAGVVYDYKVIYNPQKGRIEAYVNNDFICSWVDSYPLEKGEYMSIRSADCQLSLDNLRVFVRRSVTAPITVGNGPDADLAPNGKFSVFSLVVDRNIRWSPIGRSNSVIGNGQSDGGNSGDESGNGGLPVYGNDFPVKLKHPSALESYFLPADFDGSRWGANEKLGFFLDDFEYPRLDNKWVSIAGSWKVANGNLIQSNTTEGNTNLYAKLAQSDDGPVLYHWKAKMLSSGDNKRFGLHFFADDGRKNNRGNSYLAWFRFNDSKADQVEIYRNVNDKLGQKVVKNTKLSTGQWYDYKVLYDPNMGYIEVFINDQLVCSWRDTEGPFQQGSAISFRTGDCEMEIDQVHVYKMVKSTTTTIKVGTQPTDMLRYESRQGQAAARILSVHIDQQKRWSKLSERKARIDF